MEVYWTGPWPVVIVGSLICICMYILLSKENIIFQSVWYMASIIVHNLTECISSCIIWYDKYNIYYADMWWDAASPTTGCLMYTCACIFHSTTPRRQQRGLQPWSCCITFELLICGKYPTLSIWSCSFLICIYAVDEDFLTEIIRPDLWCGVNIMYLYDSVPSNSRWWRG